MSLRFGKYQFSPRLLPTLATCVLLPIFVFLGFWQLNRAYFKENLESQIRIHSNDAPIEIKKAIEDPKKFEYYPVKLSGRYDNTHQLLLDNRFYRHQLGFEVLTLVSISQGQSVLVNRGWIPKPANSSQLPKLYAVNGVQTIKGKLIIPQNKIFKLGLTRYADEEWPRVIPNLSWESINKALPNKKILPFIIQLDPSAKNGYIRNWRPVTMSPNKHKGYAVQWFAMAGTLVIIFITVNIRRRPQDDDKLSKS